jgi:hypothetical protein
MVPEDLFDSQIRSSNYFIDLCDITTLEPDGEVIHFGYLSCEDTMRIQHAQNALEAAAVEGDRANNHEAWKLMVEQIHQRRELIAARIASAGVGSDDSAGRPRHGSAP